MTTISTEFTTKRHNPVCYLRLKEYYHGYLMKKYGGFPIRFPEMHQASIVLESRIVPNRSLSQISGHSYSESAFNYKRDGVVFDINVSTPEDEERVEFVPICMPEEVMVRKRIERVGNNWQLTNDGAKTLRKIIAREFWMACIIFVDESFKRAMDLGIHMTKEIAVTDFMLLYDIPIELYENFLKEEYRNRKRLEEDIASNHEKLKQMSDNAIFCS